MQLSYTYWEAPSDSASVDNESAGGYIGFLNQYPDYWTQGDSIEELEKMLASLYGDIMQFDDIQSAVHEHTGSIAIPA